MSILSGARRAVVRSADAVTSTAGALGGAAVNGAIGAAEGTVSGVKNGLKNGSKSTPAAALTLAAVGVAGLVDWPILLAVGGGALVLHQLGHRSQDAGQSPAVRSARSTGRAAGTRSRRTKASAK